MVANFYEYQDGSGGADSCIKSNRSRTRPSMVLCWVKARQSAPHRKGTYSLERLCACHEYAERASWCRVWLVCALTICPPLLAIVLVDALPLKDPSAGWKANWVLWIRGWFSAFALSFGVVLQLLVTAPSAKLTVSKCLNISVGAATLYTLFILLIANYWVFPIPFMLVLTASIWETGFLMFVALTIGIRNLKTNVQIKREVDRFGKMMVAQMPLVLVYPTYSAIFLRLTGIAQTAFVLVLPVAKILCKKLLMKAAVGLEDYVPTLLISIDLFNAIYQSKCLQSAGSIWSTYGVIGIDMLQNVHHIHDLQKEVDKIHELERLASGNPGDSAQQFKGEENLLGNVLKICENPERLDPNFICSLPLRSCAVQTNTMRILDQPHALTTHKQGLLKMLSKRQLELASIPNQARVESFKSFRAAKDSENPGDEPEKHARKSSTVKVSKYAIVPFESKEDSQKAPMDTATAKTLLLKSTLELLRSTEMMLLVEYIECAIPLLYAIYIAILFHLPNHKYYPEMETMTETKLRSTVNNILIYAFLELLSLLYVHWRLRSRFGFSALHQLAFALEKEALVVQASFLCWTLVILEFTLKHYGTSRSTVVDIELCAKLDSALPRCGLHAQVLMGVKMHSRVLFCSV